MKGKRYVCGNEMELVPNVVFRVVSLMIRVHEFLAKYSNRLDGLDIEGGYTIIEYGCGPGRYLKKAAELVGENGQVYAVDIHPLAMEYVRKLTKKHALSNVTPVLAQGYSCPLPNNVADLILVLDTFHMIREPNPFLREIYRLLKSTGVLVLDDGHQPREEAKRKLGASGLWLVVEETEDHIRCSPVP